MDVLLHLTTPESVKIALPLGVALTRAGASWACFLTNDGVLALDNPDFIAASESASRIAVCERSWDLYNPDHKCPVEKGSQTTNSTLMAEASKVVSL
ncbi:hypothetical protein V5T82_04455 [Magnetovibrio sp. PR-2]|uniref:hypothetical protein n=1 Tax=Magnetovibrio sp. PR-2 TaxID=3120356 RepID=UPI002FCE1BE3